MSFGNIVLDPRSRAFTGRAGSENWSIFGSFGNWKLESGTEEVPGVCTPPTDGFRFYQPWGVVFCGVTHLKRIAIREVRRNIAVIGDRDIRTLLSEMDVVSVVLESMWNQTCSKFFAASHDCKQHRSPPQK